MIGFLLAAASFFPFPVWDVSPAGKSANGLSWWPVSCGGVEYARYNTPDHARFVAEELTRRRLGPYWYRGLSGQKVIDTGRSVSEAALRRVEPVPLGEQRKWWDEYSKRGGR